MSSTLINFRIAVESVILHGKKVLLVKRASNCKVAPGVWNVPAGKVNLMETTSEAVIRETFEETEIKVHVSKLLAEIAFKMKSEQDDTYRNMFTYLTKPIDKKVKVILNKEHSEYVWVDETELDNNHYSSIQPRLRESIKLAFKEESEINNFI